MASNPIDCIRLHAKDLFKDAKEDISRQEATDLALKEFEKLHGELEAFKKTVNGKSYKPIPYTFPDKTEAIKKITDEYDTKLKAIDEEAAKAVEPVPTKEAVTPKTASTEAGGGTEPPKTAPGETVGLPEPTEGGITHAANEVRRTDRLLPEYEKTPQSFEQWNNEAERLIREGYDVDGLMNRLEKGELGKDVPIEVESAIRKIYVATLDAEIAKNPTDELLAKQKRFVEIGDVVNTKLGRGLVSLKGVGSPLDTISDFYVAKMEAAGVDKLTPSQKRETKEAFDNVQKADENAAAAMEKYREEIANLKAENELLRQKKTPAKKPAEKRNHEDYVKERDTYRDELKKAKEKHEQWLKEQGIQKAGFGFTLTGDMVKAIGKIVKSHADEKIQTLEEIIKKVYEDIKDIFPSVTDKDIRDVIAGEYNEKKPTRSELAARMRDLKDEAYYINKLERLLRGEEPKSEKEKVKRNRQITELRSKIKDVVGYEAEVKKAGEEMLAEKAKRSKLTEKELDKAEKELDTADEKEKKQKEVEEERERKRLLAEAQKERKQFEREFEKEKRTEEKERLKAKVDEAKRIEKELSYRSPEEKALDTIIKRNEKQEKEIRERIAKGDFETKKKVPFLEDPEMQKKFPKDYKAALDAIVKREEARHEFDIALLRDQMSRRTGSQIASDLLGKTAGTAKAIVTGIDDSAVAIQTYMSILRRPRTGATALRLHFAHAVSQKKFNRWLAALHNSSDWKFMKEAGLDVTEPQSLKEREKEEIFNNRFDGTIKMNGKEYKLIAAPLKPFERAFTTLGNVTRVVGFRTTAEKYMREGYTWKKDPEIFKSLAQRLNTETGRGKLNEYVDNALKIITLGIWSPRLMAMKFNILGISDIASLFVPGTKGYYRQLHPKERLAAVRDVAQFATTVMVLSYGVAIAFGGDVDTDPFSSTFLDIRFPNGKSINLTGGFSGYIRALAQFIAGKKTSDGVTKKVGRLETAGRFFRGKTPPLTSSALNIAAGKNYMGQPATVESELINLSPISVRGIVHQIERDGAKSFFTQGIPTFFGFNIKDERDYKPKLGTITDPQTFEKRPKTQEEVDKEIKLFNELYPEEMKRYRENKLPIYVDKNGDVHINENVSDDTMEFNVSMKGWRRVKFEDLNGNRKDFESKVKAKVRSNVKDEVYGKPITQED